MAIFFFLKSPMMSVMTASSAWGRYFDAMAEFDASDSLYEITIPALVCHGADDRVIPAADGRLLADGLPKGEFEEFPGERLFYVERSREVNDSLVGFLTDQVEE